MTAGPETIVEQMRSPRRREQEQHVLAVDRICRGPYLVHPEEEAKRFAAWYSLEEKNDEHAMRQMIWALMQEAEEETARGFTLRLAGPPYEQRDLQALRRIAFPLIRLRGDTVGKPCGWNLNEEIVKHAFDGAEHVTDCPGCGVEMTWKAPVFY